MKAQKVVSVILALTLMMSMVPAAFAVELENPNDIFSEEYFAYVAKEDGNPYDVDEDISVAYQSDPVQFMNQLGKIDPMYKDFYIRTLVSVYARWSINLALNSNHLGTLYFYYASGAQAHHCDAKGKSGKGYTWDKEYGHTPPGDYYGETGGPSKDTEKYGPNKFIRMKGNQDPGYENLYVDGDYVTRGRSGLLIHGGRDQTSLWNTEGCVRIFDKDAKKITGLMDSWRSAGYHQFGRIKITRPGQSL